MKYRRFEKAGKDVSLLGFGAMRLPLLEGSDAVNEEKSIKMIRYAIDNGVNYVDTAYVYHGRKSEDIVGKALKDGYREKVFLATKMPFWLFNGPDGIRNILEEQLEILDTDYIDMYLIHDIRSGYLDTVKEWKIWDLLCEKREQGKIRYIGFSTHCDTTEDFKEILDAYPWDFCQIQLNYMDTDQQAGLKGYEYAYSKGVPVIVMEPLKGGKLVDILQPSIKKYWDSLGSERSPAEWAFRWVANLPGVLTILSGMSSMEQLKKNISTLSDADAFSLSDSELETIEKVAGEYRKLIKYQCSACKYCLPCTVGIEIPFIIDLRNSCELYGVSDNAKYHYKNWVDPKPTACTECGKCETECTQGLEIKRIMKETAELLG